MKWRPVILSLALGGALILSSCSHYDPNAITIMGKKSDLEKTYMVRIFDQYKRVTGKNINIVAYEDAEYETRASKDFADGKAPDVFMHFHNADLNRFSVEDNFYFLNDEAWVTDLTDSARNACTDADGNLLGLPFWESSVSGCYYNKTILEDFGFVRPSFQSGFNTLCDELKKVNLTPICWPADGCTWMMQFALDPVFADDPDLLERLNANETTYSEIPQVENFVNWVKNAADKGWFGRDYLRTGWDDISPALAEGRAVMTFIWDTWFYTDFKPGTYTVDDFALMPVYMGTANEGTYEGGNLNMMMVNKNSEKLDEALEFLAFCATPEHYNVAFDGIATVSCFKQLTTNISSKMVTETNDLAQKERVSTAATKITGYSAEDVAAALNALLRKDCSVAECILRMDESRIAEAKNQGVECFMDK